MKKIYLLLLVILSGCCVLLLIAQQPGSPVDRQKTGSRFEEQVEQNRTQMFQQGKQIFRFDTFGDEAFWGVALRLHQAIAGEKNGGVGPGVSPKAAPPRGAAGEGARPDDGSGDAGRPPVSGVANSRLRLILILSVVGFALILGRAIKIQTIDARSLVTQADAQQRFTYNVDVPRGSIIDRNGNVLAQQVEWKTLMAYPKRIDDPGVTAAFIAEKLGLKKKKAVRAEIAQLVPALSDTKQYQVQLTIRQLDPAVVAQILASHPAGLFAVDEAHRLYQFHGLAAQLLGYTDIDGHGVPAGAGLEYSLDRYLAGKPGKELEVRAPDGTPLEKVRLVDPRASRNVQLTIDQSIQAKVQSVLASTVQRWSAKSATAIVMDPRTGEVLAMATARPTTRTRCTTAAGSADDLTRPRAVHDPYEPGSTFKVIIAAAALEEGVIQPAPTASTRRTAPDPRSRTPRSTTTTYGRCAHRSPRCSRTPPTWARSRSAHASARSATTSTSPEFGFGGRPTWACPGRAGGSSGPARPVVGPLARHHVDRAGASR